MKENYLEALKWYGKAADMGNAEAKYKLGKILLEEGKRYYCSVCDKNRFGAKKKTLFEVNLDFNTWIEVGELVRK